MITRNYILYRTSDYVVTPPEYADPDMDATVTPASFVASPVGSVYRAATQ